MSTSTPPLPTSPLLTPFTSPTFSPITYLNSTLPSPPSLPPSTTTTSTKPSLATLSSQTQSQISTLSAHTARLSTTLTALTDDILRCSSRLAYEVELLRGEALGLVESLEREEDGGLGKAMRELMPASSPEEALQPQTSSQTPITPSKGAGGGEEEGEGAPTPQKALSQLRTLLHVRALLTATTQIFNAALSFPSPLPPSTPTKQDEEEQLHVLQQELEALAAGEDGEKRARERIRELREVVSVWKGTGEEKARGRVVDVLEGVVERRRPAAAVVETRTQDAGGGGGRGFLEGLQRLRGEMGMD